MTRTRLEILPIASFYGIVCSLLGLVALGMGLIYHAALMLIATLAAIGVFVWAARNPHEPF